MGSRQTKRHRKVQTIVIARVDEERVPDGRPVAVDLGARPKLVTAQVPRAAVWLLEGGRDDVRRAREYCEAANANRTENAGEWHVYLFPTTEADPLGAAKKQALAKKDRARAKTA